MFPLSPFLFVCRSTFSLLGGRITGKVCFDFSHSISVGYEICKGCCKPPNVGKINYFFSWINKYCVFPLPKFKVDKKVQRIFNFLIPSWVELYILGIVTAKLWLSLFLTLYVKQAVQMSIVVLKVGGKLCHIKGVSAKTSLEQNMYFFCDP